MLDTPREQNRIERSAALTFLGIIVLFVLAILMTILLPNKSDPTWLEPSSFYQVQMYEVADPNTYISRNSTAAENLEYIHHLRNNYSLLAFQETQNIRIITSPDLEKYVTRLGNTTLKITSRLMLLRVPIGETILAAEEMRQALQEKWVQDNPDWKNQALQRPDYSIYELYEPGKEEAFSIARTEGVLENYIDNHYILVDGPTQQWHSDPGVVYISNPEEYRIRRLYLRGTAGYQYDPRGEPIQNLAELTGDELRFRSRKELISQGEHVFAIEGCWYCHTDQSRTIIQDCVLNGSESFAAPPSAANEYIYQAISFPGTRRIGPDLARVGVKRPSRDWHKSHFWQPRTESPGSVMPSFRHFFDDDPSGQAYTEIGVPNENFEAIFQYLMTKGTRITPPTQAWWLGKDPVHTTAIIEGQRQPRQENR